jgi:geranylgeranyl reductase family protein
MKIYDAIIAGAGPAGAIAGYTLSKAGLSVLMLEKSAFPRRKVCGGGLTHRAYQACPFDITPIIHRSIDWGYITFRGRVISAIYGNGPIAHLIDRQSFDQFLLDQATGQGAEFVQNQPVTDIKEMNGLVHVHSGRQNFHSRYVIGADGVHSLVAKKCGLISKRSTSIAYEARLSPLTGRVNPVVDAIIFDFGTILFGFGWIFPKRDHLNVGVFRSWPGKRTTKRQLLRFIGQHPSLDETQIMDIRAFPIPLGGRQLNLHQGRILLAGDAANLADPWLGEGLYYAFASGRMAAEAILDHISGQIQHFTEYTCWVNHQLTQQLAYARRIACLMHALPYLNVQAFRASSTLQGMVIDLLRGGCTYQEVWQGLAKRLPKLARYFLRRK